MTRRLLLLLPLILLPAFAQGADVEDELILCGWDVVAILKMSDPPQKIWEWKADTCSTLPGLLRTRFATTDDCKPVDGGEKVLITSSGWGIALVERKTGQALFWALVRNAHSADLLPNDRVAVAASVGEGGNRLVVYDLAVSGREVLSRDLPHGHGVVWDEARQRLYALSGSDIRVFKLVAWETDSPDLP